MQSEGQEGREESGEAGAWVPGSDSWSAQGWLHHPPIPGPHAVPWANANRCRAKMWLHGLC